MISMAAQIFFEDVGTQQLTSVSFDPEAKAFALHAGLNGEYVCRISYSFLAFVDDKMEDGLVELFMHPTHAESDVRPVELSSVNKTVGWLCTIGALTSNQHEHADSPHFRRAAFMAIRLLLANGRYTRVPRLNHGAEITIADFYDDELSVLILHRPSIGTNISPACAEVLPSLHQYGFVPLGAPASARMEVGKVATDMFANLGKRICLFPISRDVNFEDFTSQVFRQLLPSAPTPLLRFFIYYQLIETLLARIFSDRQSATIMKMVPVKDNPVKIHPLIKKLQEDATEKKRMNLLFNNYCGTGTNMCDLLSASNELLKECGTDEKETVAEALYEVRNIIFHDLRRIPESAMLRLKVVVEQMEYVVPELLIKFRIPTATPELA